MDSPSPQARAFIATHPGPDRYDLAPGRIEAWRAAKAAECAPFSAETVARTGVTVDETEVGGIRCQRITPSGTATCRILYCFGGGHVSGSPDEDLPITATIASLANAEIIAPYTRLAPDHPFPAALDDAMAVATALSGPFALVGESAGGNLALALAVRMRDAGLTLPTRLALMSPWCDLTNSGASLTANEGRDPTLTRASLEHAARAYAGHRDLADPEISPLFADLRALPPTILTTGTRDLLQSPTEALAARLDTATLSVWPGLWHVFEFYDIPEAQASLAEIAKFIAASYLNMSKSEED